MNRANVIAAGNVAVVVNTDLSLWKTSSWLPLKAAMTCKYPVSA
jgi:hypothetical protein